VNLGPRRRWLVAFALCIGEGRYKYRNRGTGEGFERADGARARADRRSRKS
jgi:hypothetical protein